MPGKNDEKEKPALKTAVLNLRLTPETKLLVIQKAEEMGLSQSELIELLLSEANQEVNEETQKTISDLNLRIDQLTDEKIKVKLKSFELSSDFTQLFEMMKTAIVEQQEQKEDLRFYRDNEKILAILNKWKGVEIKYYSEGKPTIVKPETIEDVYFIIIEDLYSKLFNLRDMED